MSWRPDDWKNSDTETLKSWGGHFTDGPEIIGVGRFNMPSPFNGPAGQGLIEAVGRKALLFESGADAMLKAILEHPEKVPELAQWAEEYCRDMGYKEPA